MKTAICCIAWLAALAVEITLGGNAGTLAAIVALVLTLYVTDTRTGSHS